MAAAQEYSDLKESILAFEQVVLRVLAYQLNVLHPHHYVLHMIKELDGVCTCVPCLSSGRAGSEEVAFIAWNIVNDRCPLQSALQSALSPWPLIHPLLCKSAVAPP